MTDHEQLMRFLDGEAAPEERSSVESSLKESSELRRELAVYQSIKDGFSDMTFVPWDEGSTWGRVRKRLSVPVGWILTGSGLAAWIGYGLWVFLTSPTSVLVRLATGGVVIGVLVLLANVIWDRCREYRTDPYRHVHR